MIAAMGWRDLFTNRKTRRIDVVMAAAARASEQQEAAVNRLADTIERVIDAKTGRSRNGNSESLTNDLRK